MRLFTILIALFLFACAKEQPEEEQPGTSNKTEQSTKQNSNKPQSFGHINSLYVYTDITMEKSAFLDSVMNVLEQPYLITPTMSSALDIKTRSLELFQDGTSLTANNLFIVNAQEETQLSKYVSQIIGPERMQQAIKDNDFTLLKVSDITASPQQIFLLLTTGFPNIRTKESMDRLNEYAANIIEESTKLDNQRMVTKMREDRPSLLLSDKIAEQFDIDIVIPKQYELVLEEENFIWLINQKSGLQSNLIFYKGENRGGDLKKEALVLRDEFGQKITTQKDSTRMYTQVDRLPYPIQREIEIGENIVLETRGLWGIENDALGGGFVNYSFKKGDEIIGIDGFVYYAGDKKRRKMRDVDAILSSVSIK